MIKRVNKKKRRKRTNANYDDGRETNVCAREKSCTCIFRSCVCVTQLYVRPCDLNVERTFFVACIQRERVNGTLPSDFACTLSDQESLANGDARYGFVLST